MAVFVVHEERVLLHRHRKLGRWLPPGGHIEPGELPDEAAIREVEEETGVRAALVGPRGLPLAEPRQLVIPAGIQLERIAPGHEHIDLVYFAVPVAGGHAISAEAAAACQAGWFAPADLENLQLDEEIARWCRRALDETPRWARVREVAPGIARDYTVTKSE